MSLPTVGRKCTVLRPGTEAGPAEMIQGAAFMRCTWKCRLSAAAAFLALAFLTLPVEAGIWRLDGGGGAELPGNFRIVSGPWRREVSERTPNREGLETLCASASGQPSRDGMAVLWRRLSQEVPAGTVIYLLDLRQESHGFAEEWPVSWYEERNGANAGCSAGEVERDETERLPELLGNRTTFLPLGHADTAAFDPVTFTPQAVTTERAAAGAVGFRYVRFAAADMVWPSADVVDTFLRFVEKLPKNAWLHFHCQAGQGRTTTFLVIYDILRNPGLPLEEIAGRQALLGGADLLAESEGESWYACQHRQRAAMLRLFYRYATERRSTAGEMTWSDWLANRGALP